MKQYAELGVCIAALAGILAVLLQDGRILLQLSGVIGLAAVIFACLVLLTVKQVRFSGKPVSAAIARRKQYAAALFVFSLPNLLAACLYVLMR